MIAHDAAGAAPREIRSGVAAHRAALYSLLLVALASCASPGRFGTARTLAPGESAWWASLDVAGPIALEINHEEVGSYAMPLPRIGLRQGLTERLEFGVSFTGIPVLAGEYGVDLKWNFLRGDRLDLAVAPNLTGFLVGSDDVEVAAFQAALPLLVGIHLAEWISLVPQAGVGWVAAAGDDPPTRGGLFTAGMGIDLRPTARFAVQPGLYVMRTLDPSNDDYLLTGSIGFFFGAQPRYGEAP